MRMGLRDARGKERVHSQDASKSVAWKAMIHKIEEGQFPKGSKILFVHTGGLNGW
jgi:hypothetical protein